MAHRGNKNNIKLSLWHCVPDFFQPKTAKAKRISNTMKEESNNSIPKFFHASNKRITEDVLSHTAEIRKGTDDAEHFVCFVWLSSVVKAWLGNNDRNKSNAVRKVKRSLTGLRGLIQLGSKPTRE
ncbi:hypothetical protein CDAR_226041 [Caerostris darwini]|uniref:Uncharacterized protein n=1 Tax=Caerostris darwini TaxID=1538125 RepID=A0AAV4TR26_9ARAC|nr:hypothetical protein CDAR_226041 [Caerostris darwini]